MNTKLKYLCVVIASSFSLIACGGGGSSEPEPTPPESSTGNLALTINGLPTSSAADIKLSGPNNFNQTITTTETLTDLVPGTYSIKALEVSANNLRFKTINPEVSVTISAGNTSQQNFTYGVPQTSIGSVTGFGSVYVNGVRYNTDNAQFVHNDSDSSEDNLNVGMQVSVTGIQPADDSQAIASEVVYSAHVKGPITKIDLSKQSLVVLGQTYLVNTLSQFDDITFNELKINDFVEISAIATQAGQFYISHLEIEDQNTDLQVKGVVANLDSEFKTFSLGSLLVNYHDAAIEGELTNGAQVEVESDKSVIDFVLIANDIEVETLMPTNGELTTVEGIILNINDDILTINQQKFKLTDDTEFTLGDEDDLFIGSQIRLVAITQDDNLALIKTVRIEQVNELEIEGIVESISEQSFTVAGQEFTVDEFTQYEDDSNAQLRKFNFEDINIGDNLSVDAFENKDMLIARAIEREDNASDQDVTEFKGAVTAFSSPTLSIKGITVTTNTLTEFENSSGDDVTQTQFFSELVIAQEIEIKAVTIDGQLLALDIEVAEVDDNTVDLEGEIDTFESNLAFTVNGHKVTTNEFTQFENGEVEMLALGLDIQIEGILNDSGVILATKVEFEQEDNEVELSGAITDVSENNFTIAEQVITFDANTEFENGSAADLVINRFAEVEAFLLSDGSLLAIEVEFGELNELEISGVVENYDSENSFFIAEQEIRITSQTEFENGHKSLLADGISVEVSGKLNADNILVADEIEFKQAQDKTLEGHINDFNGSDSFTVQGQQVSTTSFTQYKQGTVNNIENGIFVKVEGKLNSNAILIAEILVFVETQKIDMEGTVDSFISIKEFTIDAQKVITDSSTEFDNNSRAELALGSKAKVEGYLDSNNILRATKVDLD